MSRSHAQNGHGLGFEGLLILCLEIVLFHIPHQLGDLTPAAHPKKTAKVRNPGLLQTTEPQHVKRHWRHASMKMDEKQPFLPDDPTTEVTEKLPGAVRGLVLCRLLTPVGLPAAWTGLARSAHLLL